MWSVFIYSPLKKTCSSCYPEWMTTKQTSLWLSGLEKQLLKEYAKVSPLVLLRLKAQAVLMTTKGMTPTDIGDILDHKERTVVLWLRDWQKQRRGSIFTGHAANHNAGKLTRDQLEEIQQVLQSPPSDVGLPREFRDVPQLKQYIAANFGVRPVIPLPASALSSQFQIR